MTGYGYAFGIGIELTFPVPRLPTDRREAGCPRSRLELADDTELRKFWPSRGAHRVLHRALPDGRTIMVVEQHDDAGFQIWAPRYGRHVVSGEGALIRSALPRVAAWRWERLIFAQALPLAAALRGRTLFHSSAVALGGMAIAFVGFAGAGKSSLAGHLVARGAPLVTDDVLALELVTGHVLAHPGACLAALDTRELATMSATERAQLGPALGRSDKTYLAVPVAPAPLPLGALYYVGRDAGRTIEIRPTESTAARLLGSGFLSYLDSPAHLLRHLETCSRIAETVPTYDVAVPGVAGAREVAAAIETHALAVVGETK